MTDQNWVEVTENQFYAMIGPLTETTHGATHHGAARLMIWEIKKYFPNHGYVPTAQAITDYNTRYPYKKTYIVKSWLIDQFIIFEDPPKKPAPVKIREEISWDSEEEEEEF